MSLSFKVPLKEVAHDLMVAEASTEVERNVILIVLSIDWTES